MYNFTKEKLGEELVSLMEFGSIDSNNILNAKFQTVATRMAKAFLVNKSYSKENPYEITSPTFIKEIKESKAFKNYVSDVITDKLIDALTVNSGRITNGKLLIPSGFKTFHFQDGVFRGALNFYENYWRTGFIIAIDQVSYVEVELNGVEYKNGVPSKLNTTFILYDTFGLDMEDMIKFGKTADIEPRMLYDKTYKQDLLKEIMKINGERKPKQNVISRLFGYYFICWWILQYYHNCVPLLVKIRIENVEINL